MKYKKLIIIALCTFFLIAVFVNLIDKFFDKYDLSFQLPIIINTQTPILINPRVEFVSPVDDAWAMEGAGDWAGPPSLRQPNGEIEQEIYSVFGDDFDLAMKLLECENPTLNPKAVNINDDKHKSRDLGIFQINSYWQQIENEKFLFNYEINIRIAKQIFDESGGTFVRWTCNKSL